MLSPNRLRFQSVGIGLGTAVANRLFNGFLLLFQVVLCCDFHKIECFTVDRPYISGEISSGQAWMFIQVIYKDGLGGSKPVGRDRSILPLLEKICANQKQDFSNETPQHERQFSIRAQRAGIEVGSLKSETCRCKANDRTGRRSFTTSVGGYLPCKHKANVCRGSVTD